MNKLVVIGLDGLTWDLIKPLVRNGDLPCFERLLSGGCHSDLRSSYPPVTPPAWTSITTGKNPGKHGLFDFQKISPDFQNTFLYTSMDKMTEEIWDYLSASGLKSIVINLPYSYPPKKINGIMISGMNTPSIDSEFVTPKEIKDELLERFPDYKFDLEWIFYRGRLNKFEADIRDLTVQRRKVFEYFLKKDWNLFFGVFTETDRAQHVLQDERLKMYFKFLDKELEKLINSIDEDSNLFLISDHGFNRVDKKIHLNKFLEEQGFLAFKKNVSQKRLFFVKMGSIFAALSKIKAVQRIAEMLPIKILQKISTPFLEENTLMLIDWENTKAFAFGSGLILFNNSILSENDKIRIMNDIKTALLKLKDPETDRPVIEEVISKEEAYNGPFLKNAPDLIVIPKNGYTIDSYFSERIFTETSLKKGDHTMKGIFLAYGPDIKSNAHLDNIEIYDIAPTILYMMDLPVPLDMDGRVLKEIFREDSRYFNRKIRYKKKSGKHAVKSKIMKIKKKLTSTAYTHTK